MTVHPTYLRIGNTMTVETTVQTTNDQGQRADYSLTNVVSTFIEFRTPSGRILRKIAPVAAADNDNTLTYVDNPSDPSRVFTEVGQYVYYGVLIFPNRVVRASEADIIIVEG